MSLPPAFNDAESYFDEATKFLRDHQYLYNFSNTDVLVQDVLDRINVSNLEDSDIYEQDFDLRSKSTLNKFLEEIFVRIDKLKPFYDYDMEKEYEDIANVPISPKKKHEIVRLSSEVIDMCGECGCDVVVDFGSGLGYLDQLIHERSKLNVLGLECNERHHIGAQNRQRKYHKETLNNVKYVKHFIDKDSSSHIEEMISENFPNSEGYCFTGLHACADLSVDAVDIFLKTPKAKALVSMPCCYHKMKATESGFENFPSSTCFRVIYEKLKGSEFMRIPFLRLGTQPPHRKEDSLKDSVFNLLSRAVLQLYANKHNFRLKRKKQKAVRLKTLNNDFNSYLDEALKGYRIFKTNSNECEETLSTEDIEEVRNIWREIANDLTFKKAAIFIMLQSYLQPVIENLVLYDRLVYLKENKVDKCIFKKICYEKLSPRCLALLVSK